MNAIFLLELAINILGGVASAYNKIGLSNLAAQITAAIDSLKAVHGTPVTKDQVDSLKITPEW